MLFLIYYFATSLFTEYGDWADERLWNAPEYLLTVNIAKKLWKNNSKKFITLENNIKETLEIAKTKSLKDRDSNKMRENGRADIIIWSYKNGRPKGIIEVKNYVSGFRKIRKDIDRIIEILQEDSKMKFGISTFFIDYDTENNTKNKLINKIDEIFEELVQHVEGFELEKHYEEILTELIHEDTKEYSSFAVAFTIKK